jgi:hypothetical protein
MIRAETWRMVLRGPISPAADRGVYQEGRVGMVWARTAGAAAWTWRIDLRDVRESLRRGQVGRCDVQRPHLADARVKAGGGQTGSV